MPKRLFIDLNLCDDCASCEVRCGYFYRPGAADHGVLTLREEATFLLVCRRCEEPACVAACRFDALERREDGRLKRHNLRCVSCACCVHACPFGTIYPDAVPFYTSRCDFCLSGAGADPACVTGCRRGAIAYREESELEGEDIHRVGEHLAVRAPKWEKERV